MRGPTHKSRKPSCTKPKTNKSFRVMTSLVDKTKLWYSYHMHHAYVYEGPLSQLPSLARDGRERFNFFADNNPDVHVREFEKFGIEDSRWLTGAAALRSSSGQALFVLGVASITSEAQQALLKLFEEPQ